MSYFSTRKKGWFSIENLNLSGTKVTEVVSIVGTDINGTAILGTTITGTELNVPTTGTWTTVARFDNDDVDLDGIYYKSAILEDGTSSQLKTYSGTGTALLSVRILPPDSYLGLGVIYNSLIGTGGDEIGLTEADYTPPRAVQKGSLLQVKLANDILVDETDTDNRLRMTFNYFYKGVDPRITVLTKY